MKQELRDRVTDKFAIAREEGPVHIYEGAEKVPSQDADEVIKMVAREILEDIGYMAEQEGIAASCFDDDREKGARDALLKAARWIYQNYAKEEG